MCRPRGRGEASVVLRSVATITCSRSAEPGQQAANKTPSAGRNRHWDGVRPRRSDTAGDRSVPRDATVGRGAAAVSVRRPWCVRRRCPRRSSVQPRGKCRLRGASDQRRTPRSRSSIQVGLRPTGSRQSVPNPLDDVSTLARSILSLSPSKRSQRDGQPPKIDAAGTRSVEPASTGGCRSTGTDAQVKNEILPTAGNTRLPGT